MSRRALAGSGIGALVAAVVLGAVLTSSGPDLPGWLDSAWNDLMIGMRGPIVLGIARVLNAVGGGWIATILVPALSIAALLIARRWRSAVYTAIGLLASVAVVQLLKSVFGRARPLDMLVESDFGSFPSGHTANAATLAVIAMLLFPRWWVIVVGAAWTIAMALSRTSLSVHWLSDTVGGMLAGAGVVLVLGAFLEPWVRRDEGDKKS